MVIPVVIEDDDATELPPPKVRYAALQQKRRGLRTQISGRIKTTYEALQQADQSKKETFQDMESLRRRIAELKEALSAVDDEIMTLIFIVDSKEADKALERADKYQVQAIEAIVSLEDFLGKRSLPDIKPGAFFDQAAASTSAGAGAARIPKFSGDVKRFREWWEFYNLYVHSKGHLADVEKLRLLKESLVGPAAACIRHLALEERNYNAAVKRVKDTYGSVVDAESEHARAIHRLCATRDLHRFEKYSHFVSVLSQNVKDLVTLGKSYDSLSTTLTPVILDCLPNQTKLEFAKDYRDKREAPQYDVSKLEALVEFLESDVSIKRSLSIYEGAGTSQRASGHFSNNSQGAKRQFHRDQTQVGHSSNKVFFNANKADHSCVFCGGSHQSSECRKEMSMDDRKRKIVEANACYRCLIRNHTKSRCRSRQKNCSKCNGRHFPIMCDQGERKKRDDQKNNTAKPQRILTILQTNTALPTGYVWAGASKRVICRVLFDTGAQRSFISEDLVKRLNLQPDGVESTVTSTIGGVVSEMKELKVFTVPLNSRFDEKGCSISCLGIAKIADGALPFVTEAPQLAPMADRIQGDHSPLVDILVGADFLPVAFTSDVRVYDRILAVRSIFGWVLSGTDRGAGGSSDSFAGLCVLHTLQPATNITLTDAQTTDINNNTHDGTDASDAEFQTVVCGHATTATEEAEDLLTDIQFLWETEKVGLGGDESESNRAKELADFFEQSIKRQPDGRYCVSLPFKENVRSLGSNEALARKRLSSLLEKAKKDRRLLEALDSEIQNYVEQGFVEVAEPRKEGQLIHYLPVQAVVKSKSQAVENPDGTVSTESIIKVRVVKDAAARSRDEAALNDVLHQGINLLPDLIKVLIHFRECRIAVATDVEKAFLQFRIEPEHRSVLRFFWPAGIAKNANAPIREFWMTRLDFGLVCAPWLHCAGLKHHLKVEGELHPERANFLREIADTFYMDDIIASASSTENAEWVVKTLIETFQAGCFPLNKWSTNSAELGRFIEQISPQGTSVTYGDSAAKMLGLRWDQSADRLGVFFEKAVATLRGAQPTKRNLLRGLAQVFDPLGVVAPVTVKAKVLLQQLWQQKIGWDAQLTEGNEQQFREFADSVVAANMLDVVREIKIGSCNELHVFCDASEAAYGCVVYVRAIDKKGAASISFVMAKARVSPLKGKHSIHRLELLGAVVATRIAQKVKQGLKAKIDRTIYWTDNASVLGWLRDNPSRWKAFVANRISEIHRVSNPEDWFYVSTGDNPADILSRGTPLTGDVRRHWFSGPEWLGPRGQPDQTHALNMPAVEVKDLEREKKSTQVMAISTAVPAELPLADSHFSSWGKSVRVLAWVRRYLSNLKIKKEDAEQRVRSPGLSSEEFCQAEMSLIKCIQKKHFASEFAEMPKGKLSKSSKLFQHQAFVDDNGLMRCRSRLQRSSELSYDEKNPVILPGGEPFVNLLAHRMHVVECMHSGGIAAILHHMRSKYLILGARRVAKKVVRECKRCVRFRAKPAEEETPPLPAFRIERAPPFSFTGVDFAGPLFVRADDDAKKRNKAYIALFVCAVTRAIHLELVSDLSTFEFLMALRRFLNRRQSVSKIISDNATTFVRSAKELKIIFAHIRSKEVQNLLANASIEWEFITPNAPWFGGWWERLVAVVKKPLRKILGTNVLRFRELTTVLTDIEAMVNTRPLTAVSTDPNEIRAMCPADLLYGYRVKPTLPEMRRNPLTMQEVNATVFSQRWKYQQSVLNSFWGRFKGEYLEYLRSAHLREPVDRRPLLPGDVCILRSQVPSRAFWQLCRVVSLYGGRSTDRRARSCWIRLPSGQMLKRPIAHLFRLEVGGEKKNIESD